jgi:hydrogenase maturation protease
VKKILLHAYGNPGRGDDGLGNAFIEAMDTWIRENDLHGITTDSSYQLNVEDAAVIAEYDVVIFIDASKAEIGPFAFDRVDPRSSQTFTTHSATPAAILALCNELYHATPLVYILQIRGYHWDFGEGISEEASLHLQKALDFAKLTIEKLQRQT